MGVLATLAAVHGLLTIVRALECVLSSCSCVDSKARASVVVVHGLNDTMLCGTFQIRDRTHVPCTGRQICAPPRKAPYLCLKVRSLRPERLSNLSEATQLVSREVRVCHKSLWLLRITAITLHPILCGYGWVRSCRC